MTNDEEKEVRRQIDFAFEQGRKQGVAEAIETAQAIRDQEAAKRVQLEAQIAMQRELLEQVRNGLQWYQDEFPEVGSETDSEMIADIDRSLIDTKPTADAFVARIKDEGKISGIEDAAAACEMVRYSRTQQGNQIGFNAIGECIDKLQLMLHGLRKRKE